MKTIGVLANCMKAEAASVLARLEKKASSLGLRLVTCDQTGDHLRKAAKVSGRKLANQADVLLVLGGDGSMLRAMRALHGADVPLLGVNLGSLGFLTSVTEPELEKAVDALASGKYTTSIRTIATCRLFRRKQPAADFQALNDIAIGWGASSRVAVLELSIDGEPVSSFVCDGLIISTPTGSTAHSLSAGGPILHPQTPALIINPLCPHTLSNRSLVVPDQCHITVRVAETQKKLLLSVDGQEEEAIDGGDRIDVKRSDKTVRLIHLPGYTYFSVVRQKLHWRGSSV